MAMNENEQLWSRTDHILADLFDATTQTTWVVANKDVERKNWSPAPEPYPRPGVEPKRKKFRVTEADLMAFQQRTRRG